MDSCGSVLLRTVPGVGRLCLALSRAGRSIKALCQCKTREIAAWWDNLTQHLT